MSAGCNIIIFTHTPHHWPPGTITYHDGFDTIFGKIISDDSRAAREAYPLYRPQCVRYMIINETSWEPPMPIWDMWQYGIVVKK
jgi:hypothetical protein